MAAAMAPLAMALNHYMNLTNANRLLVDLGPVAQ